MTEPWHSCISGELEKVEDLMLHDLESENPELTEMCQYVISSGGKRLRPALCIMSYGAVGGKDMMKPVKVGAAFEIIHSATLVHDDINDQGEIRRGRKTLHKEYTVSKAIIAGDYMFAMGFRLLAAEAPQIVDYIVDASASMGAGEFVQKDFEHASSVTEDDYIEIITGKTAKLFEASSKSGAAVANADGAMLEALGNFSHYIGLAFQIVDDTLDVTGDPHNTGKAVGTDLIEGKPTLPVIYAMQDPDKGPRLIELFEKADVTTDDVAEALELIRSTDSVDRCLSKAREYVDEAVGYMDSVPDSIYKDALLDLASYIVRRDR
ncbi:MAG TPA: polyprenyl synthetase family protein [Euryarchaeota archaeon]|nr:polyprenyl synthetase family protein [Euryarchaeota archaeon]